MSVLRRNLRKKHYLQNAEELAQDQHLGQRQYLYAEGRLEPGAKLKKIIGGGGCKLPNLPTLTPLQDESNIDYPPRWSNIGGSGNNCLLLIKWAWVWYYTIVWSVFSLFCPLALEWNRYPTLRLQDKTPVYFHIFETLPAVIDKLVQVQHNKN